MNILLNTLALTVLIVNFRVTTRILFSNGFNNSYNCYYISAAGGSFHWNRCVSLPIASGYFFAPTGGIYSSSKINDTW